MAVVQISRIKHRSGLSENLPQLARGELGLSVDNRKVYIGNGGTGAPQTENIEILTEFSDVFGPNSPYTYADAQIGYSVQTGASSTTPVIRSLQDKIDDFASVRDFGAIGDGSTNDTASINRALYEMFAREPIIRARRALYFPAGEYVVDSTILIPSFAKLVGEGPNSTIIKFTSSSGPAVRTADSLQQISSQVGANGATRPRDIVIQGMTFTTTQDVDIMLADQVKGLFVENTHFVGALGGIPTDGGTGKASVRLQSSNTYQTEFVNFKNCEISQTHQLVIADNDMQSITFDSCSFHTAHKGFKIGEGVTGSTPSVNGPAGMKVLNSLFDDIYNRGVHVFNGVGFVSAYNYYRDVGNTGLGGGNPAFHVIDYEINAAHSIGDFFDRNAVDDTVSTRRINIDSNHRRGFGIDVWYGVKFGGYIRGYGQEVQLSNNVSNQSTGVTYPDNDDENIIEVDYAIVRNNKYRQGVLRITHDATGQVIDDDFNENNGSTGVTFSLSNAANVTTLNYTTDNQTSGTFYYSIRILR